MKVAIIGSGLSGLAAALTLRKHGISAEIYESDHRVGGRVQTYSFEGYKLDKGFQVLLNSYDELKNFVDLKKLNLKPFKPGALVRIGDKDSLLTDPRRDFFQALLHLTQLPVKLTDAPKILEIFKESQSALSPYDAQSHTMPYRTTLQYLEQKGLSSEAINHFFKPFFAGVLLTEELDVPDFYFQFLFKRFASGEACLPAEGMQSLPQHMSDQLDKEQIHFNSPVRSISNQTLHFAHGGSRNFDHIVLAVDPWSVKKLVPEYEYNPQSRSTSCFWYSAKSPLFEAPYLWLNSKTSVVHHIAPMSQTAEAYAPKGRYLYAINSLLTHDETLEKKVFAEVETLFPHVKDLKLLKVDRIPNALPARPLYGRKWKFPLPLWMHLAGDYLMSPSIDGALRSGRVAAENILSLHKQ